MSETYAVQYSHDGEQWIELKRSGVGQMSGTSRFKNVCDAFIFLGKEMQCDPEITHRIVRYVEEVVIAPPARGEEK